MCFDQEYGVRPCFGVSSEAFQTAGIFAFTIAILDSIEDKETYIAHVKAVAPLLCLRWVSDRLRGSNVLWFLDNLRIVSCLCKGSSTVVDVGCVIMPFLLKSAALGANRGMSMWILKPIFLMVVPNASMAKEHAAGWSVYVVSVVW